MRLAEPAAPGEQVAGAEDQVRAPRPRLARPLDRSVRQRPRRLTSEEVSVSLRSTGSCETDQEAVVLRRGVEVAVRRQIRGRNGWVKTRRNDELTMVSLDR